MTKLIQRNLALLGVGILALTVFAPGAANANNFNSIAGNIVSSISNLPTLLSALAYMFGLLLAVLGIMKIKDHVENPGQTPLKDGAIRLLAGGGLFALPIILDAMKATVGSGSGVVQASMSAMSFG